MNAARTAPSQRSAPASALRDFAMAVPLGGVAMAVNLFEVQLGWGLHFIFGNALIFAFLRLMQPRRIFFAAALASFYSVVLWGHPWAWIIWTIEAAALAYTARRTSPVRADILFWLIVGAPLLAVTYGWIMGMDRTSLFLVIGKQAVNGVLNVALGEALYFAFLVIVARRGRLRWPTVSIEGTVQMFMMLTILVPTVLYLSADAPKREASARAIVGSRLEDRLYVAVARLDSWRQSREAVLEALTYEQSQEARPSQRISSQLLADFDGIAAVSDRAGGDWTLSRPGAQQDLPGQMARIAGQVKSAKGPELLIRDDPGGQSRAFLLVRLDEVNDGVSIAAALRPGALTRIAEGADQSSDSDLFLIAPDNTLLGVDGTQIDQATARMKQAVPVLAAASREATLVGPKTYGNSLMSDLKQAELVRVSAIPGLAGWRMMASAPLEGEVLRARQDQSVMFLTLFGLIVATMLLSAGLASRLEMSLRRIARAAADVALTGARMERLDSLVISELNDISANLALADNEVSRERSALVDYQRRLLSIATHSPVVVYALGRSGHSAGRLLYISDSVEKMLGYSNSEARTIGWLLRKIHPDDRPRYEAAIAALHEGAATELEYRIRHRLGHWVWIYDTIAFASDAYFKRSETVGLMIDVTDRKVAAEQLVQADKMAGLGQMVAGIAHELNQPLNFIQLAVSNLKERAARDSLDKDRLDQKLGQVLSHVNRAAAIIKQMRVFGRTSSEPSRPVRITEVVDAVLTMVRPQLAGRGIAVDTAALDPALMIQARPNLLEQVLLNLLLNAEHAIGARIEGEPGHPGRIKLATEVEGNRVALIVDDNGTGIPPEALKKLFEPFFTTKPPKEGMGLGLSISYEIVRDLGGEITAANHGDGARFTIRLPLA